MIELKTQKVGPTAGSSWAEDALAVLIARIGGEVYIAHTETQQSIEGKSLRVSVSSRADVGQPHEVTRIEVVDAP